MGEKRETAYFSSIPWTAGQADCGNWRTVIKLLTMKSPISHNQLNVSPNFVHISHEPKSLSYFCE